MAAAERASGRALTSRSSRHHRAGGGAFPTGRGERRRCSGPKVAGLRKQLSAKPALTFRGVYLITPFLNDDTTTALAKFARSL